jgi:hypothetical protein
VIIVIADGRLGNELFFLAAAHKARRKNENVVGFRFLSLHKSVHKDIWKQVLKASFTRKKFDDLRIALVLGGLIRLRLVSELSSHTGKLMFSRGLFPVTVLRRGFFQSDYSVTATPVEKIVSAVALLKAPNGDSATGTKQKIDNPEITCFIHVRRGDYLNFPAPETPASLPKGWYLEQINAVRDVQPKAKFAVFSDDVPWCVDHFGDIDNVQIFDLPPLECLSLMSQCSMGILSASSFSWWGAKLASQHGSGPFIAPLYWYWWGANQWNEVQLGDSKFLDFQPVLTK